MKRFFKISIAGVCLVLVSSLVLAAPPSEKEIGERLAYIRDAFEANERAATIWQTSWLAGYGTATFLQAGMYITEDSPRDDDEKHERHDMLVGAISSSLGAVDLIFNPLLAHNAPERLDAIPEGNYEERIYKLVLAEQMLQACARRERLGKSWETRIAAGVVNLLSGVAVALDDSRTKDGLITFAIGTAVSELQIFTQPTASVAAWEEYAGLYRSKKRRRVKKLGWNFSVSPCLGGLVAKVEF